MHSVRISGNLKPDFPGRLEAGIQSQKVRQTNRGAHAYAPDKGSSSYIADATVENRNDRKTATSIDIWPYSGAAHHLRDHAFV